MNHRSKLSIAALAAVLGLGIAAGTVQPSLAQFAGGPGGPGMRGHHGAMQHGPRADRIDGRIAFLKAELKITAAQESQWADFEKVLRAQSAERKLAGEKMRADWQAKRAEFRKAAEEAKAKGQPVPKPTRASVTAVDRMERQQKFMKARLENQEKVLDALKPLYASLSDEQKKTADQLIGNHGGRGGHGQHRGR